jgi:transcription-repair coupling factor (superfamily II helicase)
MASKKTVTIEHLADLVPPMQRIEGFDEVVRALTDGRQATIDGAWGSACALSVAALVQRAPSTLLIVLPRLIDVDEFAADVQAFLDETPTVFPAWESLPSEHNVADVVFGGRLRVLNALSSSAPPSVVVTSIGALLQPVPSRKERGASSLTLKVGEEIEPHEFLRKLVDCGFERVHSIERPGEFAMHGGIVDVFPPDQIDPVRFEFFGDEIESIRRFDAETQRKIDDIDEAMLSLVAPVNLEMPDDSDAAAASANDGEHFLQSLPAGSWMVLTELQETVDEGRHYLDRLADPRGLFGVDATLAQCAEFPLLTVSGLAADTGAATCRLRTQSIERFTGPKNEVLIELAEVAGRDESVLIACHNEGERDRLRELLAEAETDADLAKRVQLCVGRISHGFRLLAAKLVVLGDHELFGRTQIHRVPRRKKIESRAIDDFLDLNEGDLVVHLTHGIGRYRGMKLLEKDERAEEHLAVEFRDSIVVYVPVSLIHLVQKYVGATRAVARLSKVGGKSWVKKKQKAEEAVADLAADMLRLQATRASRPGIAYPEDSHWQHEFGASFPYTETDDQLLAIADVKRDMERSQPTDRLICGDVGYGKTEVAMRAAFKAIDAGRQVAVLVPTTVLAEQHCRTFTERMAEYPFVIEGLSRFRTKKQQRKILEGLESGGIDLVIGTHRLVQKDVRFRDLGLLVIDEEQRFGVDAKEMLKRMRLEVDVVTMTATPIPRTLHMSLLGVRDISNLTTAPQDRVAVETRLGRFDEELIRNAIIRELNRNGQVYFVHNKVYDIQTVADRVQSIVPEAKIDIGHGQMAEGALEGAMLRFVSGETDVLVCTTIIESGLDIPNANTIFIDQADRYGLADLHQLRGRVGRYKHRAYCYLLLDEGRSVTPIAAKRLRAIEEYSELGAGFKIAMRDLEIRGAGNILGTEQSGHIAAVGYELYCQLLEHAVGRLKKEPVQDHLHVAIDLPVSAFFPEDFMPPGRQKIDVYRKMSTARNLEQLRDVGRELEDRFGTLPEDVTRLLSVRELQVLAAGWQIDEVRLEERFARFGYRNSSRIKELSQREGSRLRIADAESAYLLLDDPDAVNEPLLDELKSVLRPS